MLKRYVVRAESIITYEAIIYANDEHEAWDKGKQLDGGEFDCLDECDWKVFDVFEEEENA